MFQNTSKNKAQRGFTIVELVITITVLAVLAAILIPAFAETARQTEQKALRMELDTAYTAFAADCGFRNEPVQNMDQYIFITEDGLQFTASAVKAVSSGYRWNGNDNADVATVATGSINTSATTAIYGPFNGYYILGAGMALSWTGSGTSASPYLITSYRELRAIGEQVARGNNMSGKHFRLETDITIHNSDWLPIGGFLSPTKADASVVFSGTFDGNGNSISLSYGGVDQDGYCLFGSVKNATIKNLVVAGYISVGANAGGIVGTANSSTIQNCHSQVKVQGDHHVGGIVGNATGSTVIQGCRNSGDLEAYQTAANTAVGGIVGETASGAKVRDCINEGNILTMGGAVGGIAGIARGEVLYCVNQGSVTSNGYAAQKASGGQDSLAGGIVGWGAGTATVNSCGNTGKVTAAYRSTGGIAGADAKILKNCANTGAVTGSSHVGGIVGTISNSGYTVANVMNSGTVSATGEKSGNSYVGPAGGIIGRITATADYTLNLAANSGQVHFRKGTSGVSYTEVGMILGSAAGKVELNDVYRGIATGVYVGTNSATGTAVGKSSGITGDAATETNAANLGNSLTNIINGSYSGQGYTTWTMRSGYYGNKYVPVSTKLVQFDCVTGVPGTLRLSLNTAFVGASTIYAAFPEQAALTQGETKFTFKGWLLNGTTYTPGQSVSISANATLTASWTKSTNQMEPLPFG